MKLRDVPIDLPTTKCQGKVRYPDKKACRGARNKAREHRGQELRCYPCPLCKGWHLTKH